MDKFVILFISVFTVDFWLFEILMAEVVSGYAHFSRVAKAIFEKKC